MRANNYPTIEQVLNEFIINKLSTKLNTAIPAVIESYEHEYARASVIPTISKKYVDGQVIDYKPIENIPVITLRTQNSIVHLPINKGDTVLLIICQRSMDKWLKDGLITPPSDRRQFDITDAIAIPGLFPFSGTTGLVNNTDFIIKHKNSSLVLKDNGDIEVQCDGEIKIGNSGLKKLVNEEFKTLFDNHVHNVSVAGTPAAQTGITSSPSTAIGATPISAPAIPTTLYPFGEALTNNELTSQTTVG